MIRTSRITGFLLILFSVLTTAGVYDYHHKVNQAPQSTHHWRQSDCASITYNFYNLNLPFWKPQIMGLVSDSGRSALNLTSEVPLYYWSIAQMYKIIGQNESILRGIDTGIFLAGLVVFSYFLWLYSGSLLWAIFAGLLLFSSPVLVYYGNNYLSNAPAFGFALVSLGMLVNFFRTKQRAFWWISMAFFLLAGSLKITGLFLFMAVLGSAVLFRKDFVQISRSMMTTSLLLVITPLLSWLIYARYTNEAHHTVYFSTTVFPLWDLSTDDIRYIFSEIKKLWLKDYGHWSLLTFYMLLVIMVLVKPKLFCFRWRMIMILLIAGLTVFSLLQFYTFMQHDYYVINMFILPAVGIVAFSSIHKNHPGILKSPYLLIPALILLFFNLHYASQRHEFRYTGFHNDVRQEFAELYDNMDPWLARQGVHQDDTVIFIADDSHTSLYLMRRFGWTTHKMAFKDTSLDLYFNRDSAGVARSIENGASFLVLNNWYDLYSTRSYLAPFARNLVAQKGQLMVFDLRSSYENFTLPEPEVKQIIIIDPDSLESKEYRVEILDFGDAPTGSRVFALNRDETYNFTTDINDIEAGSLVQFDLWIKANPEKKLVPVISSLEPGLLFLEKPETLEERDQWRHLQQEYLVENDVAEEGLRFFFWNPENAEASVDALSIRIYHPLESSGENGK
jgi:hypothetical protein